ncbi:MULTISPECIES: hypothetical protein [Streptomyces]|uniref:hypothetical protein n=1 Tax=Streptomyces TaxID=1883 RepID=UPI000A663D82|nr:MULTISPECIES: hypothetical protein [Streptomyces]
MTAVKKSGGKKGGAKAETPEGSGSQGSGARPLAAKPVGPRAVARRPGLPKRQRRKPPQVTLKANVLPPYRSKSAFMADMRTRLLTQRNSGKPSLLDFLLGPDGQ